MNVDMLRRGVAPTMTHEKAKGWMERIIRFSPSWFNITMGTGVNCSLILILPWKSLLPVLRHFALAFLLLDVVLFALFSVVLAIRYTKFPEILKLTLTHSQQSLFLGCIPMGLVTILSGTAVISTQFYGLGLDWALVVSYIWWFDVAISCALALLVPYMQFTVHAHASENFTASLILPVVPTITAAAVGGRLAQLIMEEHPNYAYHIILTSYSVLGIGLPLAMMILALYLQRLTFHHLPPRDVIVSAFLPLGPCGQGGFALILLGKAVLQLAHHPSAESLLGPFWYTAAPGAYAIGIVLGLALFGLGMWWLAVAICAFLTRAHNSMQDLHFNMGWWGFTFPLASLALCTLALADELQSLPFKIIGTVLVILVFLLWGYVAVHTATGAIRGTIFYAPCLAGWSRSSGKDNLAESQPAQPDSGSQQSTVNSRQS